MTEPTRSPRFHATAAALMVGLLSLVVGPATTAWAQPPGIPGLSPPVPSARQVTLFTIAATPGDSTVDPKLKAIAPQLRRLKPNHGFKLLDVQSRSLAVGQSVTAKVNQSLSVKAELTDSLSPDGKVQFRFSVLSGFVGGAPIFSTIVSTPPNQPFFADKMLDDGSILLIGIGAR